MADYQKILEQCLKEDKLWEDPDFPASWRSLRMPGDSRIVWKRPFEIVRNPKYIVKKAAYYDINQGDLGNCWFLASAISLAACRPRLMDRVAFLHQSFDKGKYAGIFRFRFWHYGNWKEVLVDDRLPTRYGKLTFAQNRQEPNEFWAPLLEKAYAKLNGSYGALVGGIVSDALVDLTGGITERVDLMDPAPSPDLIAQIIQDGLKTNTVMGGAIWGAVGRAREALRQDGLYAGHAYGIMASEQVTYRGKKVDLLHVRNPHGRGEWSGRWSDGSVEWRELSASDRARVHHVDRNNGDFWMCVEDFVERFDELQMCHLSPDGMTDQLASEDGKTAWRTTEFWGEWVRGVSAGGMSVSFNSKLYWRNPQYKINLEATEGSTSTMVVSLMREVQFPLPPIPDMSIGFNVFKLREGSQPDKIDADNYFEFLPRLVKTSGAFTPYREVARTYDLHPGTYVLVPCTRKRGQEANFYLRVFSERKPDVQPVPDPVGPTDGSFNFQVDRVAKLFKKVSHDGTVDSFGLRNLLSQILDDEDGNKRGVTLETSRSLLAYLDSEMTGKIDLEGVRVAWDIVKICMRGFGNYDKDKSGAMDVLELEGVFKRVGFSLNRKVLKALVRRYGNRNGEIEEDDFLQSFFRILTLYEKFKKRQRGGKVSLDMDEWLLEALYA